MKSDLSVGFTAIRGETDEQFLFAAAAITLGFELAENTPQVSNTYTAARKYEPGEPGDIRYYMPYQKGAILIEDLISVWLNPKEALDEASNLPGRILTASRDGKAMQELLNGFDIVYLRAVVAHLRLFQLSRISLPDTHEGNSEERDALDYLDTFASRIDTARDPKTAKALSAALSKAWKPAMVGWIKAFKKNYLELRNLWKQAPPTLKIQRNGLPPLVLHKGPKFKQLLERWT